MDLSSLSPGLKATLSPKGEREVWYLQLLEMKISSKYLIVGVLLMVALGCVWADDYVDDVYYSPQPKDAPAPSKGEVQNESRAVSQSVNEEKVSQSTSEVNEDGTITIEYLPQTTDTVVVIRVKK